MATERNNAFLRSQLATLDSMIDKLPEESAITRTSLEYRRSQVLEELEANPPPDSWPVSAHLRFGGMPVTEHGIDAEFGAEAISKFADVVTELAATTQGPLKAFGPIPNRDRYKLLLTGTSHGSFGFHVEEVVESQASFFGKSSPMQLAFERIAGLFDTPPMSESPVPKLNDRVANSIEGFLRLLTSHQAQCTITFNDTSVLVVDNGQISREAASREEEIAKEVAIQLSGYFVGFLPSERQAEFHDVERDSTIRGKVGLFWDNPEDINRRLLYNRITLHAIQRRVGNRAPTYTFEDYTA